MLFCCIFFLVTFFTRVLFIFLKNIYLFGCTESQLQHVGSSVEARELSVACGTQYPDQDLNLPPLLPTATLGAQSLSHWTIREVSFTLLVLRYKNSFSSQTVHKQAMGFVPRVLTQDTICPQKVNSDHSTDSCSINLLLLPGETCWAVFFKPTNYPLLDVSFFSEFLALPGDMQYVPSGALPDL